MLALWQRILCVCSWHDYVCTGCYPMYGRRYVCMRCGRVADESEVDG